MNFFGLVFLCAGTMIGSTVITLPLHVYQYGWISIFISLLLLCLYSFYVSLYTVEGILNDLDGESDKDLNFIKKDSKKNILFIKDKVKEFLKKKKSINFYENKKNYSIDNKNLEQISISYLSKKYLNDFSSNLCDLFMIGLFMSLLCAYISGLSSIVNIYTNISFEASTALISGLMIIIVGNKSHFSKFNSIFFVVKIICFIGLLILSIKYFSIETLQTHNLNTKMDNFWSNFEIFKVLPMFFTAFGFHGSISYFMKYNLSIKNLKNVFFTSSIIAFLIYLMWILIVLSNISSEEMVGKFTVADIVSSFSNNNSGVYKVFSILVDGFAFFALLTSIIGVGITLIDFLNDNFYKKITNKIYKDGDSLYKKFIKNNSFLFLTFGIFFICLMIINVSPYLFIKFLSFAALCLIFIAIIIPCLIVYKQRYSKNCVLNNKNIYRVSGGKFTIISCLGIGVIFIVIDIYLIFLKIN